MTNVEQAKMQRNSGLNEFLSDNTAAYAADNAFTNAGNKYAVDYITLLGYASQTGQNNSGFSREKLNAKTAAGQSAAACCARAQVILDSLGLSSISRALNAGETYYTTPADATAAARLAATCKLLNENLATITPDYLTSADIANLQTLITTFAEIEGSSQEVHALSPRLTARFKTALTVVNADVKALLKLGKKYQLTNLAFYQDLKKICRIPPINIRHTSIMLTITDRATGAPISGALAVFSNSKKTALTGINGILYINIISPGDPILTITAAGYPTYTSSLRILSGKENTYAIMLTKA